NLSKDDVVLVFLEGFFYPLGALKPDQFYLSGLIKKGCCKPFFSSLAFSGDIGQRSGKLSQFCLRRDIADLKNFGPVKIPVRKMKQQISIATYIQFFAQQFAALRTYAF